MSGELEKHSGSVSRFVTVENRCCFVVTGQILIFHVICVEAICRALVVVPVMAIETEGRSAGRLRAGDVHPRACAAHQLSEYKLVEVHRFYSSINVIPVGAVADLPCQAPGLPGSKVAMGVHRPFDRKLSTCI